MNSPFPDGEMQDAAEIGAVDDRSVRVWVRQPGVTEVRARLEVQGRQPIEIGVALSEDTDWTGALVLTLPEPAPGRPFVCTVGDRRLMARLAPDPMAHAGLTFGFGSCNRPYQVDDAGRIVPNAAAGIYAAMQRELEHLGAHWLLLLGDQIYSDELEPISVRDNLPGDEQNPPPLDVAVAAYRRISRGFLGQAGFRRLREHFPTYCMWDDHDIFNNWGSRLEETPLDRCLFQAASRVYREYQHQHNPTGCIGEPPYNYSFRHGDIGFLVLDVRGKRDYQSGRLLGAQQWEELIAYLEGDDAATAQTLFVAASIPVAHVSRWVAKIGDRLGHEIGDSVRDRWCSSAFVEGRDELLERLFAWQTARPERQVFLLGGDVHSASAFTIRQFTSSALSTPHTLTQMLLNSAVVRAPNLFEPRYRFRRHLLDFANNYGLVRLQPLPAGGHRVSFTVRAWRPRSQRLKRSGRIVCQP